MSSAPDLARAIVTTAWETHKAMKQEFKELNDVYWEAEQEFHAWRKVNNERRRAPPAPALPITFHSEPAALQGVHRELTGSIATLQLAA